jgi:hypothetical protein
VQRIVRKAVKDNPGMSDRAIADKLGVSQPTVSRARKQSTDTNVSVDKRIGKDGKKRRKPRKNSAATEATAAAAVLDKGRTYKQAAVETGINGTEQVMKVATAREEGRREAFAQLLSAASAKNFTAKGVLRIEDAIRVHKARLEKQFEQRVNEEVRRRIDAADDATRASYKKLNIENARLLAELGRRAVFTETQYKQMLMLCHPDDSASPELKARLLQILVESKAKLIRQ